MKTAVADVIEVYLDCPHCGEAMPAPCGSLAWVLVEDLTRAETETVTCKICKRVCKVPRWIWGKAVRNG